jgi:nitroimidazol reductase NimA-like FMN-containing flavoprotein (pyridoxamine 5'-phosphate oxidase superfamily)
MSTHAVAHPSSHFHEIARGECEAMLGAQTTGRVAWNAPDGPQLLPVTYGMYAGDIVFRTSPYGVLSQLAHRTLVAFEIDDIDQTHGAGWSVLVRGRARAVVAPHELVSLWTQPGIVPWAPGIRNLWIGISVTSISGRRVKAPFTD